MFHTWTRLKDFILRAGQVILIVVVVLSFLNSVGSDGSFGNQNSEKSLLSTVSKKVGIAFYPMGLSKENWPASVGIFTGIFAKEAVVGTLDTLYTQLNSQTVLTETESADFDFAAGIKDAFKAIPAGFSNSSKADSSPAAANSTAAATGAKDSPVSVMVKYFDGKIGAFAYLLFILIYSPCVAAVAAIYRETNLRWAIFSVCYLTTLAWIISTVFYQTATIFKHPASSAGWILAAAMLFGTLIVSLKIRGKHQVVSE
jgi:ferrous iron transport protein B